MTAAPRAVVDAPRVLELLDKAVHVHGADHTAGRFYIDDRGARCIAGQVLHDLGVDDDTLRSLPRARIGAPEVREKLPVTFSTWGLMVLETAQDEQDCGAAWGDAVRAAGEVQL